jgi:hypothetical protein
VGNAARSEGELAGLAGEQLVAQLERELAFEHVERLIEPVMMKRRSLAFRGRPDLDHGYLSVGLLASQQHLGCVR